MKELQKKVVNITLKGEVEVRGKFIKHLEGGFGEDCRIISDLDIASQHNVAPSDIRKLINRNISRFKENVDYIDFKNCPSCDDQQLESFGYNKMQQSKANNIYILSERGYSKVIKIMDTDLAWEIYDDLLDGYFTLREKVKALAKDSYMIEDPIERAKAWIREQEERQALQLENKQQQQIIGELKPKADYTDKILKSKSLMTITAIAKDYGMSGNELNNKLHELGVQYKQGKQWLLYSKYHACGYTHSETITYKHRNGLEDTTLHTKWTQKGRLFLYELLKQNGILPMIEKEYE